MSNIPRVPRNWLVYKVRRGVLGFKPLILPEQKNIISMKYIVQKSAKPGNLVVSASPWTFSAAKAGMHPPKRRTFIEFEVDPVCSIEALPQLILLDARQVLSTQPDTDEEEQVCSSAEAYMKEVEAIEIQKRLNIWKVPEGLLPMQKFPPDILYHLGTYFSKKKLL